MKHLFRSLPFFAMLLMLSPLTAQRLNFSPVKPQPGEKLNFTYQPSGSDLAGLDQIEATAYLFEGAEPVAVELPLQFNGTAFTGTLPLTANTKAALFSFKSPDGNMEDNNDKKGYKVLCYLPSGEQPVAGALAEKANIVANYAWLGGIKRDYEKAMSLLNKEFDNHPASLDNENYLLHFAKLAKRHNDDNAKAVVRQKMEALADQPKASEAQLLLAKNLAAAIGETEKEQAYGTKLKKKYPDGIIAWEELILSFTENKELSARIAIFEKLKLLSSDEARENALNGFAAAIATEYARDANWEMYERYISLMTDRSRQANTLNSTAWGLSGESIEGEAKDVAKGKVLSWKSLKLLSDEIDNPVRKPSFLTAAQYRSNLKNSYAMYADTYALLAFKAGNKEEALKYQQIACDADRFESGELNERYAVYYEEVNGAQETEALLSKLIAEGKATAAMKEQHKRLFMEYNTLESAYDKYRKNLEQEAINKKKDELREKVLNMPAPLFKLTNLQGKDVSLESLKGKVVVLDFWATWCGPCKASFPGMQKTLDKFAGREDVEFLFINTWEKVKMEEKVKNAADFISSKSYTFHVLMDNENQVVADYGVEGIPTKFVVDKNGVIRFKSVGFSGNDDDLITELSMMIEMAGEDALTAKLTSAP